MANNQVTTQMKVGSIIEIDTASGPERFLVVAPGGGGGSLVNLTNIFWVDQATTVALADQTGNIEAPFATLTQALALCTDAAGYYEIMVLFGDYHLETLPVSPIGAHQIAIRNASRIFGFFDGSPLMPAWVTGTTNLLCEGLRWNTPMGGQNLKLIECELDAVTAANQVEASDCDFAAPLSAASVSIKRSNLSGAVNVFGGGDFEDCEIQFTHTFSGAPTHEVNYQTCKFFTSHDVTAGTDAMMVTVRDCQFHGTTNFIAASGTLDIDSSSYQQWSQTGTVTGMLIELASRALTARVNVNVPAIVAAGVDYIDVSLVGTLLAGIPQGTAIVGNPTADLAAAGAGGGAFVNCWVNSPSQVRCTFVGILTGGVVPFDFTTTGW
jgi:hypothetical protein